MKRKIFLLFLALFFVVSCAFTEETYTLKAGISIDKIPKEFYGTWRVSSSLLSTNNGGIFKENSVDLWNLSRAGNVITLDNPFSGAHASISVDEVNGRLIKFKKTGDYDSKKLTDTVQLNLGKETFTGTNYLKLDTISEIDGHVIKSDTATYKLTGEKISGAAIK
ncbi:MAG: hypothetical protein WCY19_04490 [Candidatus Gastranaerophilaceae bacterium]